MHAQFTHDIYSIILCITHDANLAVAKVFNLSY